HNAALAEYAAGVKAVGGQRGLPVVDLFERFGPAKVHADGVQWTDNGVHLTQFGYWSLALFTTETLGAGPIRSDVRLSAKGEPAKTTGATVAEQRQRDDGLEWTQTDAHLPPPPAPPTETTERVSPTASVAPNPAEAPFAPRLAVDGLADGVYTLTIDGETVARKTAAEWAGGVAVNNPAARKQAEELRRAVVRGGQLYFLRYRPPNITYLLGFRRHEQGQNAKEIDQLERLTVENDATVWNRAKPQPHVYRLTRDAVAKEAAP
ncbi:MAG: hypothetical protein ACRC1K_04230, partial [Planctomycetia bacterium]